MKRRRPSKEVALRLLGRAEELSAFRTTELTLDVDGLPLGAETTTTEVDGSLVTPGLLGWTEEELADPAVTE